ncbi:hypothetical protein K491DRAFT_714229 [Lophiostoma macrostomum CBS 122681]|uniref:SRR1-like domain-containing protein n=1 Tax=Lophiostoma macrostomum CBS 122681 TaxID=1314788 RepID=A0A6A6TEA5_9PLEO|nr:hypothetical protein K491DRAFT_714229 [Lophiostoma macrostomum CBS 122681]
MNAFFAPVDMNAFERSLDGRRIFIRQLMEEVAKLASKAQDPASSADLYIQDIQGSFWSPSLYPESEEAMKNFTITWRTYWDIASPDAACRIPMPVEQAERLRNLNPDINSVPQIPCSFFPFREDPGRLADHTVDSARARLEEHIFPKVAKETKEINKIVCFGLGPVQQIRYKVSQEHPAVGPDGAFDQHLAARDIADTLDRVNGSGRPRVKICVQDLAYKAVDRVLLNDLGFELVEDPHGWLKIDEHTLVFHAFCPFRPYEMIADLTHEYGGPAAILGDIPRRTGHGLKEIGPTVLTPSAYNMLSCYEAYTLNHNEDLEKNLAWLGDMALWYKKIQKEK